MTYIIAPAEKDNSHGSKLLIDDAKKKPAIAKIGSTIPLKVPSINAFFLF